MFKRKPRRSREFKKNSQVIDMEEARRERREKRAMAAAEARLREEEKARNEKAKEESTRKKARKSRRRLIYIGIIGAILITIGVSAINIVSLLMERKELQQKQQALIEMRDELMYELEHVDSPEYIEQQARTHLRLIKPGEVLYILPKKSEDNNSDTAEE